MKTIAPLLLLAAAFLAGCEKKNPETPEAPPAQKPGVASAQAAPADSLGGAPKRALDDARSQIDAVQKKETADTSDIR